MATAYEICKANASARLDAKLREAARLSSEQEQIIIDWYEVARKELFRQKNDLLKQLEDWYDAQVDVANKEFMDESALCFQEEY